MSKKPGRGPGFLVLGLLPYYVFLYVDVGCRRRQRLNIPIVVRRHPRHRKRRDKT